MVQKPMMYPRARISAEGIFPFVSFDTISEKPMIARTKSRDTICVIENPKN